MLCVRFHPTQSRANSFELRKYLRKFDRKPNFWFLTPRLCDKKYNKYTTTLCTCVNKVESHFLKINHKFAIYANLSFKICLFCRVLFCIAENFLKK